MRRDPARSADVCFDSPAFPPMITRAQLIDVLFVIVPHSLLLDIAGPAEAFRLANLHREASRTAAALSSSLRGAGGDPADVGRTDARRPRSLAGAARARRPGSWWSVNRRPTLAQVTPEIAVTARWLNDRLRDALLDERTRRTAW